MESGEPNKRGRVRSGWWYGYDSPLGYSLLFYILVASSVITLLGTALQLGLDYKKDISIIRDRIHYIEGSHRTSIGNNLWNMDHNQLQDQLAGILELPVNFRLSHSFLK